MCQKLTFTSLLDKTDCARDIFFGIWRERMHLAGYVKPVTARPDGFVDTFNGLLTLLRPADDEREALSLSIPMMRKALFPDALPVN